MPGDEEQTQAAALPTGDRIATLAGATVDAISHKAKGEHETEQGRRQRVDAAEVDRIIESWPDAPKNGARGLIDHYGLPNEATPTKLFWYHNGPWKRTELTSDVVLHDFPSPHSDFLTQFIDYRVPVEFLSALGEYDGSCLVDRTAGEAAARCDSEAANLLTLNLMHEIVTGKRSVEDARETYAQSLVGYTMGRAAPYCERFLFDVAHDGTADTDTPNAGAAMLGQTAGKVKDVVTGTRAEASDRRSPS
jgi:hypothetical protein